MGVFFSELPKFSNFSVGKNGRDSLQGKSFFFLNFPSFSPNLHNSKQDVKLFQLLAEFKHFYKNRKPCDFHFILFQGKGIHVYCFQTFQVLKVVWTACISVLILGVPVRSSVSGMHAMCAVFVLQNMYIISLGNASIYK